jgi:capsid assembly protease
MDAKRIAALNLSPIWAIQPEAVLFALGLATPFRAGMPGQEWEAAKPSILGKGPNKVAVIPIQGVLTNGGPSWYGTNYQTITKALEAAGADPDVKHVVLAVDSPGGDIQGLPEASAVLAEVAKTKHVSAIVEGTSASAAYWLTSQAHDVTLTPSGEVGSVGVRMMHVDMSKMLDNYGVKITELSSGDFKTEWSPYKPLSEEAQADMQPRIEAVHNDFIGAVTTGRAGKASADIQAKRFGEGRMFSSDAALQHGLVDKVQSARDFYRAITPAAEAAPSFGLPKAEHYAARVARERAKG